MTFYEHMFISSSDDHLKPSPLTSGMTTQKLSPSKQMLNGFVKYPHKLDNKYSSLANRLSDTQNNGSDKINIQSILPLDFSSSAVVGMTIARSALPALLPTAVEVGTAAVAAISAPWLIGIAGVGTAAYFLNRLSLDEGDRDLLSGEQVGGGNPLDGNWNSTADDSDRDDLKLGWPIYTPQDPDPVGSNIYSGHNVDDLAAVVSPKEPDPDDFKSSDYSLAQNEEVVIKIEPTVDIEIDKAGNQKITVTSPLSIIHKNTMKGEEGSQSLQASVSTEAPDTLYIGKIQVSQEAPPNVRISILHELLETALITSNKNKEEKIKIIKHSLLSKSEALIVTIALNSKHTPYRSAYVISDFSKAMYKLGFEPNVLHLIKNGDGDSEKIFSRPTREIVDLGFPLVNSEITLTFEFHPKTQQEERPGLKDYVTKKFRRP